MRAFLAALIFCLGLLSCAQACEIGDQYDVHDLEDADSDFVRIIWATAGIAIAAVIAVVACMAIWGGSNVLAPTPAHAGDNGRFSNSPLKAWFDKLASGKGLCCSFADGVSIADVDWGIHGDHYWVIINGVRYAVPPEAVVTEPNKFGPAVVWPYGDFNGETKIRCFMPGSGA
jgi:hypothetical protein